MGVLAKFRVQKIECQSHSRQEKGPDGKDRLVRKEMRTIVLAPVYSADPESENRKFWESSPTGEIRLGTINLAAAEYFELDGEYYVEFGKADDGA
jgi:hypothetical protein